MFVGSLCTQQRFGAARLIATLVAIFGAATCSAAPGRASAGDEKVSFSRDIRPLLSDRCYLCHGPDEAGRQAELRLDTHLGATEWAISPGDPDGSEVVVRVTSDDLDVRMPPPESNKPAFTAEEVSLLKRWIEQGAEYEKHWAYESPRRPEPPVADRGDWNRHPIDRFVLAQLCRRGWTPSPRADRRTLLRRASFDLTGLPPKREQIRAFLEDESPDAWSRAVDRLLAAEAYGEQQAKHWLDAARYADSDGYQYDFRRDQWVWRDWVIAAFNANMPFDDFTIEQLAGDLLPDSTPHQRLATAFHRNHPITVEGGIIDEEYRVEYVLDRTTTTGAVWLGMTLGCARCHDHKYDPLSQKEFYELSAFFNQVPERGMRGFLPAERIVSPLQQSDLESAERTCRETEAALLAAASAWGDDIDASAEALLVAANENPWDVVKPTRVKPPSNGSIEILGDGEVLITGSGSAETLYQIYLPVDDGPVHAVRLLADPASTGDGERHSSGGRQDLTLASVEFEAAEHDNPKKFKPLVVDLAVASEAGPGLDAFGDSDDKAALAGWPLLRETSGGQPVRSATFVFSKPVPAGSRSRITVRLRFQETGGGPPKGRFRLVTDTSSASRVEAAARIALAKPPGERSPKDRLAIVELVASGDAPEAIKRARSAYVEARARKTSLFADLPDTMIMRDIEKPRGAYVLERGEYDKRREHVDPGTPAFLPPMPEGAPRNRLGLAQWLTMPNHPLTSRVAVNRFWLQLFGVGLLDTPEDFGLQSELPSHPELLDWLAVDLVESGWDVKRFLKSIMMSETYRQASVVSAETHARDPLNRYLARGPRLRLDAESIRDSALAVSGLLNPKIGGPSVFPYHPEGLWLEVNNRPGFSSRYEQDTGGKLYRRSLYTYWKRSVTPPSMAVFDAPTREYCVVRRSRTNTPLQAFVMLHDPQFVEAARKLAGRMLTEGGRTLEQQIRYGFELSVGRLPEPAELRLLVEAHTQGLEQYRRNPERAQQLLSIGESRREEPAPLAEHAAMTAVARLLMNLSEFVTKG